jgi:crotonobetainyl-CoA:carnitine CoA-transferase CaiB-like acyl-CoA transferase
MGALYARGPARHTLRPGAGDDTRGFGPPWIVDRETGAQVDAAYYASANRGKRSNTLDFTTPSGQRIAQRLAAACDIVLENYKVGALARFGLYYAAVRKLNPRVIYCSITGFGQTGPYAPRPGYDSLIQGMGGVMSLTGEPDGLPQKVGVPVADLFAGLYGCIGILAALRHRERTGQGQQVDIGMLDTSVAWLANQGMNFLATGENPRSTTVPCDQVDGLGERARRVVIEPGRLHTPIFPTRSRLRGRWDMDVCVGAETWREPGPGGTVVLAIDEYQY